MKTEKNIKMYSVAVTGLLVLSIASSAYFWNVSTNRELERNAVEMEKESLLVEKGLLAAQLENLKQTYDLVMSENGELKGTIEQNKKAIAEKSAELGNLKKQQSTDRKNLDGLKRDVKMMRDTKIGLEAEVSALQKENEALRIENERLSGELRKVKNENLILVDKVSELTEMSQSLKSIQESIAPAGIRATAFRVEVEKRNDKLTVKGKKARELSISFDLMDVPENLHGMQKVFLAITDNKGTPIPGKNNKPVKIGPSDKKTEVVFQQVKEVILVGTQRLGFTYSLEQKLAPGYYRASVYTEHGWIGSVSFRVS
jgi:regulator of replication initiation timing